MCLLNKGLLLSVMSIALLMSVTFLSLIAVGSHSCNCSSLKKTSSALFSLLEVDEDGESVAKYTQY